MFFHEWKRETSGKINYNSTFCLKKENKCCDINKQHSPDEDDKDGKVADFWIISLDSLLDEAGSSLTINPILAAGAKSSLSRLLLESFIGLNGSSLMDVSEGTELSDIYG